MSQQDFDLPSAWTGLHNFPSVATPLVARDTHVFFGVAEWPFEAWSRAQVTGPTVIARLYGGSAEPMLEVLASRADDLMTRLHEMEQQIEELRTLFQSDERTIELREISDDEALQEVKAYFEAHDGEVLYPSEIAEALRLDYEQTSRVMNKLATDGKIAQA